MNGPTILFIRKGRILFTSIPGAIDACRASITSSSIMYYKNGSNIDAIELWVMTPVNLLLFIFSNIQRSDYTNILLRRYETIYPNIPKIHKLRIINLLYEVRRY